MDDLPFPEPVAAAFSEARTAYGQRSFAVARAHDEEALRIARELGHPRGEVRATRFLGLCDYRRGALDGSEELLRQAREGAIALGWVEEELLACNHLGATLRKLGKLDEADALFRWAVTKASSEGLTEAHARLALNYGAFLDHLGDRDGADVQYVCAERLLESLDGTGRRLANARGLVSRGARLRGDAQTALEKALSERDLGRMAGDATRESRGWLHIAQAKAALGAADDDVEVAFDNAEEVLDGKADVRTPIDLAIARGRFLLDRGRLPEADARVVSARASLGGLSPGELEHPARVHQLAARVAVASGLHGEGLWHLSQAMEALLARFEPIADPRLASITRHRRRELAELAEEMLREAGAVERESGEEARVQALLARLDIAPGQASRPREWVDDWSRRVREEADRRWRALLPSVYPSLSRASQGDLVLSEVVYHGHVGDLPRSLLLLFVTLERELRERVFQPLGGRIGSRNQGSRLERLLRTRRHLGLGDMLEALAEPSAGLPPRDARAEVERRVGASALSTLARLRQKVISSDGVEIRTPLATRNAIAHGESWILSMPRTSVDAIKRAVAFGKDSPLAVVARIGTSG